METINQQIASDELSLLYFYTNWHLPSKQILEEQLTLQNNDFKIIPVNADQQHELVSRFKIIGIPSFLVFQNGEIVIRHSGMPEESTVLPWLKKEAENAKLKNEQSDNEL
ncbi:MAG: thioredoxin family protein [Flavobacteriia bacterium]|nr:thioredoxin family protein [Flavobacteriia bacterium]OJX37328.1 MAG: hypothetical protein BGO87_01415 [Flavobacteriia bacterium 40-80]